MMSPKDLELLEKAVADREEHAKDKLISPVDPDARMGKKTSKTWPGYKAHIVMEEETGIITGVETTPANATDGSQLKQMLKDQKKSILLNPRNSPLIKLTIGEKTWNRWLTNRP
jgi:IS5 family transposase